MALKQKAIGIGGATLVAVAVAFGAGHISKKAPAAPIAIGHGICENGRTVSKVTVAGKVYKVGTACTAIPDPVKPKARRKHG